MLQNIINKFCYLFESFVDKLNNLDNFMNDTPLYYIILNILFLAFTIFIIGISYLFLYVFKAFKIDINKLLEFQEHFNILFEIVFSIFFVILLLFTLSRSYKTLNNVMLTENVWIKSSLFFVPKLYTLIFIAFVLGIFKGFVYVFAHLGNINKPELYNPVLVIIFAILIFINILLPILLQLYRYFGNNKLNIECSIKIFQSLTAISLVGLIAYYIFKALQIWVSSSILSFVKSKDIINLIIVCTIFVLLFALKCFWPASKFEEAMLKFLDSLANLIQRILFPNPKMDNVSVRFGGSNKLSGGRRAKKYK